MDMEIPTELISLKEELKNFNKIYKYFVKNNIDFYRLFQKFPNTIEHIFIIFRLLNDIYTININDITLSYLLRGYSRIIAKYKYSNFYFTNSDNRNFVINVTLSEKKKNKFLDIFKFYNQEIIQNNRRANVMNICICQSYTIKGTIIDIYNIFIDKYRCRYINDIKILINNYYKTMDINDPIYQISIRDLYLLEISDFYSLEYIIHVVELGRNTECIVMAPKFNEIIEQNNTFNLMELNIDGQYFNIILKWFIDHDYCDPDTPEFDIEADLDEYILTINKKTNIKSIET